MVIILYFLELALSYKSVTLLLALRGVNLNFGLHRVVAYSEWLTKMSITPASCLPMDGKTAGNTTAGKTTAAAVMNDGVSCSAPVPATCDVKTQRKRTRTRSFNGTDSNSAASLNVQSKRAKTRQAVKDQSAKNGTVV